MEFDGIVEIEVLLGSRSLYKIVNEEQQGETHTPYSHCFLPLMSVTFFISTKGAKSNIHRSLPEPFCPEESLDSLQVIR
jgi:hypothetical protein